MGQRRSSLAGPTSLQHGVWTLRIKVPGQTLTADCPLGVSSGLQPLLQRRPEIGWQKLTTLTDSSSHPFQ